MNCETSTRVSTSSLYKNGRLIAQASALFLIRRCQNIDFNITAQAFCCRMNRILRIFFVVRNSGTSVINNATLIANIRPASCCERRCKNEICKEFIIDNLQPNNSNTYYLDVPFPCNKHYIINGQIRQDNVLLKEDCTTI